MMEKLSIANLFGFSFEPVWEDEDLHSDAPYKLVLRLTWEGRTVPNRIAIGKHDLDRIAVELVHLTDSRWMTYEVWDTKTKRLIDFGFCPRWLDIYGCKAPVPRPERDDGYRGGPHECPMCTKCR